MRLHQLLLHYTILVGLPFVGVLLVMRAGASLSPPPSLEGRWRLEADFNSNASTACAERLARFQEPVMFLSQSGVFVELRLPNQTQDRLSGRLEGNRLLAEAAPALFGGDVFDLLRISAEIYYQAQRGAMRGVLSMPRKIECAPVPFFATRESPSGGR